MEKKEKSSTLRLILKRNKLACMMAHTCNPSLRRQRQEDCKFKASLDCIASPCLKNKKTKL
jgi:hypothetical protein